MGSFIDTSTLPESKRERMRLAVEACQRVSAGTGSQADDKTLAVLAKDPKWEVRKALADNMAALPEKLTVSLLAILLADTNQDVRRSAQRARREQSLRPSSPASADGNMDYVDPFEQIAGATGKAAINLARRIASEQMNAIIGSTVHELRNILMPVSHHAEQLLAAVENLSAEQRQKIDVILEQNRRSLRMLDALRQYSRPVQLHLRQESVLEMAQTVLAARNLGQLAPGKNIEIRLQVAPDLRIDADRDKLLCVFDNLLKNAIEVFNSPYCQQSVPCIVFSASYDPEDALVLIRLEDNGTGIPPEALEQLRRFLPGSNSSKPGSMGFGLPNVARFVRAHGGSVSIDSELDRGTSVCVRLPVTLIE